MGARPHSLGETFVAIADDGNTVHWNPAGLAQLHNIQLTFNYADLYCMGLSSYYTSFNSRLYFIPQLADYITIGIDAFAMNIGDDGLDFGQSQYKLAIGFKPDKEWPILNAFDFGVSAKYLTLDAHLDSRKEVDAKGCGVDLGVLYHLNQQTQLPLQQYLLSMPPEPAQHVLN